MDNAGNTPDKNQADQLPAHDPRDLRKLKFGMMPGQIKDKLYLLSEDAKAYDKWFSSLSEKDQLQEYETFNVDGEGEVILRNKAQLLEDKAHRMRYIRVIEKLKREGKLNEEYRLK